MNQDPEVRMVSSTQARLLNMDPGELEKVELQLQAAHPDVGTVDLRQVLEEKSDRLIAKAIAWLEGLPWIGKLLGVPLIGGFIKGKIRDRIDAYVPDELEDDLAKAAAELLGRVQL